MCSSLAKTNRFEHYKPKTLTKIITFLSTTKKNTLNHTKDKLYFNHQQKSNPKHKNFLYSSNDEEQNTKKDFLFYQKAYKNTNFIWKSNDKQTKISFFMKNHLKHLQKNVLF